MLPMSKPETEAARQVQLQASQDAELTDERAAMEQRDVERWQLLFAKKRGGRA